MPNQDPPDVSDQDPAQATPAPKKPAAKKATAKKATAKKATAKKATAKKATAKKATAKKGTAKKATAKKAAAKGTTSAGAQSEDGAQPAPPADLPTFPPADLDDLERPWVETYPPLVPASYPYPDVAFPRLLDDAAKDFPDSVALEFLGKALTYRRLAEQVDRLATSLQSLGVEKGDRVGIALPNSPQHVLAFLAVLRLGGIVVEIDPRLDEEALAYRINDAGCSVLIVLDPVYAKIERLKGQVPTVQHVIGTAIADSLTPLTGAWFTFRHRRDARLVRKIPAAEGVLRLAELVRTTPALSLHAPITAAEDVALLVYGPGDRPRAVMLTHRNLLVNVFQIRLWVPDVQAGRETLLCAVPFSTSFGLAAGLGLGILSAATMSLVPTTDRSDVLSTIERRKPTLFPATAGLIEDIAAAPNLGKQDLKSVRVTLCDTSLLSSDVVGTFEEATGGRVREGLGVAEATALTHANPVYGKAKTGRVGLPLTDTVCALVDPHDRGRLASGTSGELVVRGPQVMKGYWNRPEESAAALVDGWLFTGLVAEVDEDGYYCILGRVEP